MKTYLKLNTAILILFMYVHQQIIHTIKPTTKPMFKVHFSHKICHKSNMLQSLITLMDLLNIIKAYMKPQMCY